MTDTHNQAPLLPLEERARHPDLWFEDGTVVVATKSMLFRVYRGILSRQSPFFRGMFTLPQPASAITLEGVPIIEFQDDAMDVAHILIALHDPSYYEIHKYCEPSVTKALLRLATRYQVAYLQQQLVYQLSFRYPYALANFGTRTDRGHLVSVLGAELILLAQETQAMVLLPVAFYELAVTPSSDWPSLANCTKDCDPLQLSSETILEIFRGREKLQEEVSKRFTQFLPPNPESCTQFNTCTAAKDQFFTTHQMASCTRHPDILLYTSDAGWMSGMKAGLCQDCAYYSGLEMAQSRREIWHELPAYFNLPTWRTLKDISGCQGKDDDELEVKTEIRTRVRQWPF